MATFTVKEIAEKIQRPMESPQAAIDRLRNWTKEGLIKPAGERHPGTGRARRYSEKAFFDAVLLQILTDCLGIPAVSAAPILKTAKKHVGVQPNRASFLIIGRSFGDSEWEVAGASLDDIPKYFATQPGRDTHTLIDLDLLFARIGEFEE